MKMSFYKEWIDIKNLELGELCSITLDNYDLRRYEEEVVITLSHIFTFENNTLPIKSRFACPGSVFVDHFEEDVACESIYQEDVETRKQTFFTLESDRFLEPLIRKQVQEAGGFAELTKLNVTIDESVAGTKVRVASIDEHVDDEESLVLYLDVEGIDPYLMLTMHKNIAPEVDEEHIREFLGIADVTREHADVFAAFASAHLPDELIAKIAKIAEAPVQQAIQLKLQGEEFDDYFDYVID